MMRRGRVAIRRTAALTLGTVLALALAEAFVRVTELARHGIASDRGGLSGVYQQHHPRLGWLGIPGTTVRHHTTEFDVEYTIDAEGFRATQPTAPAIAASGADAAAPRADDATTSNSPGATRTVDARDARPTRLTLLGDSFVFGQGVAAGARIGERLADALGIDCVNRGIPATGTGQHVLAYSELPGAHHGSDVVVLLYLLEAVERVAAGEHAGRRKPRFVLEDGELVLAGVPVPEDYKTLDERRPGHAPDLSLPGKLWLQRHSRLYALLREHCREPLQHWLGRRPADLHPAYATDAPEWQVVRALLALLADRVRADGAELVVAIVPQPWHLSETATDVHQRTVLAACADAGIEALDLTPALAASRLPTRALYFPTDGHWTPTAHALAARSLAGFLIEKELVPRGGDRTASRLRTNQGGDPR